MLPWALGPAPHWYSTSLSHEGSSLGIKLPHAFKIPKTASCLIPAAAIVFISCHCDIMQHRAAGITTLVVTLSKRRVTPPPQQRTQRVPLFEFLLSLVSRSFYVLFTLFTGSVSLCRFSSTNYKSKYEWRSVMCVFLRWKVTFWRCCSQIWDPGPVLL